MLYGVLFLYVIPKKHKCICIQLSIIEILWIKP